MFRRAALIVLSVAIPVAIVVAVGRRPPNSPFDPADPEVTPITLVETPATIATGAMPATAPTTSPAPTTSSETTSETTTLTMLTLPPTTVSPLQQAVAQTCESLLTDGFETRRVMYDAFAAAHGSDTAAPEELLVAESAECADAVDRLVGAVEIRSRMEAIDIAEEDDWTPIRFSGFSCDRGRFQVEVTNDFAAPLGLHLNFAMYLGDDRSDSLQSSRSPIVVWSIAPGATEVVSGRFVDFPGQRIYCQLEGHVFDADPSDADASMGGVPGHEHPEFPELTGDDPAEWFPALLDFERNARTTGDIDLAAVTEDVRSMAYDELALWISEGATYTESVVLEVCERGRSQPDDDRLGFVYLEQLPDDAGGEGGGTRLSHGLFRRGADGQWRWLSTARYFESTIADDCSGVDPEGLAS